MRLQASWLFKKRTLIYLTILAIFVIAVALLQRTVYFARQQRFRTKFVTTMTTHDVQQLLNNVRQDAVIKRAKLHDPAEVSVKVLIARSRQATSNTDPILSRCPMYEEFRRLEFMHSSLRRRLCRNVEAYRILPGEDDYPVCRLQRPFNADLLDIVRQNSEIVSLTDANGGSLKIFAYNWSSYLSGMVKSPSAWDPMVAQATLQVATSIPDVTFLDLGSSLGVYGIQAAKLGLPVVALDANIRNLLRMRLSLDAASLDADLVWNAVASDRELKYLKFPDNLCTPVVVSKRNLVDTIPVMPIKGSKLGELIGTKNLAIRMNFQSREADFLSLSEGLFADFTVAAVQMKWLTTEVQEAELDYILRFFVSRQYEVWKLPYFEPLNPNDTSDWESRADIIWIHRDFLHLTTNF